jgi:hypothetical protein
MKIRKVRKNVILTFFSWSTNVGVFVISGLVILSIFFIIVSEKLDFLPKGIVSLTILPNKIASSKDLKDPALTLVEEIKIQPFSFRKLIIIRKNLKK